MKRIFKNKKASQQIIFQIVTFILIAIFLALVIYGLATNKLQPLIKKVGLFFDMVLVQLKLKDQTKSPNDLTERVNIPDVGEGNFKFDVDNLNCVLSLDNGEKYQWDYSEKDDSRKLKQIGEVIELYSLQIKLRYFRNVWFYDLKNANEWKLTQTTSDSVWAAIFPSWVSGKDYMDQEIVDGLSSRNFESGKKFLIELYRNRGTSVRVSSEIEIMNTDFNLGPALNHYNPYILEPLQKIKSFMEQRCR